MKQKTENKNPLKWFFLGIGIAFLPFVVMLVQAAVESNNQLDGLIEILKKYTAITTFFTTPLSLIIAIIGGGMAYRKYFEDKEKEQKTKADTLKAQIKISDRDRANRLYDLINQYGIAYDNIQLTKSTKSISGSELSELRMNVQRTLEEIQKIDSSEEIMSIYKARFSIQ